MVPVPSVTHVTKRRCRDAFAALIDGHESGSCGRHPQQAQRIDGFDEDDLFAHRVDGDILEAESLIPGRIAPDESLHNLGDAALKTEARMITNTASGTRIDEIASGIYRISTPSTLIPGGFSFNQYLVVDKDPLLFHSGPRGMFSLTKEAIGKVMPVESLRYVGLSHFEADECGAPGSSSVRSGRRDGLRRRPFRRRMGATERHARG